MTRFASRLHAGFAILAVSATMTSLALPPAPALAAPVPVAAAADPVRIAYRTVEIDGIKIFYREAGDPAKPTLLLLHGFPSSSHMFRELIPALARTYHVVAPDYPGFGQSDAPPATTFNYSFDKLAGIVDKFTAKVGLGRYALYVQDYGAPIGYRLAAAHPERISGIIVQNGNAYEEGFTPAWAAIKAYWADTSPAAAQPLRDFLSVTGTKFQYLTGVREPARISPDGWASDQAGLDRPGNAEIQLALFHDYRANLARYPEWQAYFRRYQPPTLIVWGRNDPFFSEAGARAYQRDLPKAELHLYDTGHFALEEEAADIAARIIAFAPRLKQR